MQGQPPYLNRKLANESHHSLGWPEKYGALLEHGADMAPGPVAKMLLAVVR